MNLIKLNDMKLTRPIFPPQLPIAFYAVSLCAILFTSTTHAQSLTLDSIPTQQELQPGSSQQELQPGSIKQESQLDSFITPNSTISFPHDTISNLSTSPLRYDPLNLLILNYQATKPIKFDVPDLRMVPGQAIPFSCEEGK